VSYLGAPAIALVGSAEDIAGAIMEYRQVGITQFLFMGWPDLQEMTFFSQTVLPLVRANEASSVQSASQSLLGSQPHEHYR
jgi:alkanesulfonate monooxygenase